MACSCSAKEVLDCKKEKKHINKHWFIKSVSLHSLRLHAHGHTACRAPAAAYTHHLRGSCTQLCAMGCINHWHAFVFCIQIMCIRSIHQCACWYLANLGAWLHTATSSFFFLWMQRVLRMSAHKLCTLYSHVHEAINRGNTYLPLVPNQSCWQCQPFEIFLKEKFLKGVGSLKSYFGKSQNMYNCPQCIVNIH